ncbi:MAG: DUF1622 domain-containing protein [Clostridiales bacterium]|nr:DUF1622 domain-containing protein [Clostridiales bacterium]
MISSCGFLRRSIIPQEVCPVEIWRNFFETLVHACIYFIEFLGIVVILISMFRGLMGFLKGRDSIRLELAQGIMLGLEFKIGSEVLRSVIVSGWNELLTLGAVIVLRALLTLLLHFEINEEEKRQRKPSP